MSDELVNQVLQSPNLRDTILTCIRQLDVPQATSSSPIPQPSSNINSTTQQPGEGVRNELRRLFPTLRSSTPSNTPRNVVNKRGRKLIKNINFTLDVILVKSKIKRTLLGMKKVEAYEKGFAVSAVEFNKSLTADEIKNKLKQLFPLYLENKDFEILVPVGGYLAKPNLTDNQQLDGRNLFTIFYRKNVYIRPIINNDHSLSPASLNEVDTISTNNPVSTLNDFTLEDESEFTKNLNLMQTVTNEPEPSSLNDILLTFKEKILETKCNIFNIFREDIYKSYLRAVRRKSFSPYNKISVCFTDCEDNSEGAGDAGGPKREMFRLLLKYIKDSRILKGPDNEKYIVLNRDALEKEEYFEAGRIIVLSIIHCGLCPHFFSFFLFNLISTEYASPNLNHIMDDDIKQEIESALTCDDINSLRTLIIEGTYFRLAGWDNISNFERKEDIIKDVIKYYAVEHIMTCINQLIDGLKTMNFYDKIRQYPEYFVEVMCSTNISVLNLSSFEALFQTQHSEEGSNRRRIENRLISYWKDFLIDCYENEPTDEDYTCTLQDILTFCTGSDTIPLFGFPSPISLQFLHDDDSQFPKANTCGLVLFLPTVHIDYEPFKSKMLYGIKNGMVFGFW